MTFRPERLRASWPQTWRDLWSPLLKCPSAPPDLAIEMVREVAREARPTAPGAERRNGIYLTSAALNRMDLDQDLSSLPAARAAFRSLKPDDFRHSLAATRYLEAVVDVIEEFDHEFLKRRYISLAERRGRP